MFKTQSLINNPEACRNLFASISVVVTRAEKKTAYYLNKIKMAIKTLEANEHRGNVEELILLFLQDIIEKGKLELFKAANREDSEFAGKSSIIESLDKPEKGWEYYDFQNDLAAEFIIQLPFKDDFEHLSAADKEKYDNAETKKLKFLEEAFNVLGSFLQAMS